VRRQAQRRVFESREFEQHLHRLGIDAYLDILRIETGAFGVLVNVVVGHCKLGVGGRDSDNAHGRVRRRGELDTGGQCMSGEFRAVERDDEVLQHVASMRASTPSHITWTRDPLCST
jgi:hypothetical protein